MFSIRRATCGDFLEIQKCNLTCLPENYPIKYFLQHHLKWPQLTYVCSVAGKVVGYVMGKIDDEDNPKLAHGHITSVAVHRDYRSMGIAEALMQQVLQEMRTTYGLPSCKLNVRVSNAGAQHVYKDMLGFELERLDEGYFQDKEDSQFLNCDFTKPEVLNKLRPTIACLDEADDSEEDVFISINGKPVITKESCKAQLEEMLRDEQPISSVVEEV